MKKNYFSANLGVNYIVFLLLGVKYRPKSHQCPSSAKMTEQNAANVENRMEVEVGGSENNVRNNNRNGYKEVETDSITQKTVLSSPAKYSTYDEGSGKHGITRYREICSGPKIFCCLGL